MSRLIGNPGTLKALDRLLREMPRVLAHRVAEAVAPKITALAQASFDAGQTVYGEARPLGVRGNRLTLVASGTTRGALRFVATGRIVRCVLGPRYAKYLVGKYKILPPGDLAALPPAWDQTIGDTARELAAAHLEAA